MKRVVLALALVACKTDFHHTVDALPADSTFDSLSSSTGEPPPNAVKLTITRAGVAEPGVPVIFQAADSSLVSAVLTDDTGRAWALAPANGYVTAREHKGVGTDDLVTFAAVQPGDALVLDMAPTGSLSDVTVSLSVPAMAGATGYRVFSPCGGEVTMSVSSDVIRLVGCPSVVDLVVMPINTDGDPLGTLYAQGVGLATGNATVTGTYTPLTTTSLSFTNVPSFVGFLGVYDAVAASAPAYSDNASATPASGAATMTTHMPVTSAAELTATSLFPTSGQFGQQQIYNWHPASTAYALDVGSVLLPSYSSAPVFDANTHSLTWTASAGSTTPDIVRASLHFYRDDIPAGRAWDWNIVAPFGGTSVTLPTLTVVDFDFNPKTTDTGGVQELMTISLPGGFAGFHPHGFDSVRGAISGTLGRIVVESLYTETL